MQSQLISLRAFHTTARELGRTRHVIQPQKWRGASKISSQGQQQRQRGGGPAAAHPTRARELALQQLIRIDEDGAFSGLVGGSPGQAADMDAESDEDEVGGVSASNLPPRYDGGEYVYFGHVDACGV
jgi:hypothetical protein